MNRSLPLISVGILLLAGCVGGSPSGPDGISESKDDGALYISGLVVDQEIIPIESAVIVVEDRDGFVETDATGRFKVGPVDPGEYIVTAEKKGYATQTVTVVIDPDFSNPLTITLAAVALDVPYQTTTNHVTFVICASYNPVGGVPCTKLVDWQAGTNLSPDEKFAYTFKIQNPGLADVLVEMVWNPQSLGKDAAWWVQTPAGQAATALTTKYFAMSGGPPLRGWIIANEKNQNRTAAFDATPGKVLYEAVTAWSDGNATVPRTTFPVCVQICGLSGVSLYLNHRTETWMTSFYNRPGDRAFSALPDR